MGKALRPSRNIRGRRAPGSACCPGRRLDLLDPSPLDIEIEDIAHGLARVARWNGQTLGDHAFSVAQHSWWWRRSPPTCARRSNRAGGWRRCCTTRRSM